MGNCTGLTMAMVAEIMPRFEKLRRIDLPRSVTNQDPALTQKITADFAVREKPIEINTPFFDRENTCPFHNV